MTPARYARCKELVSKLDTLIAKESKDGPDSITEEVKELLTTYSDLLDRHWWHPHKFSYDLFEWQGNISTEVFRHDAHQLQVESEKMKDQPKTRKTRDRIKDPCAGDMWLNPGVQTIVINQGSPVAPFKPKAVGEHLTYHGFTQWTEDASNRGWVPVIGIPPDLLEDAVEVIEACQNGHPVTVDVKSLIGELRKLLDEPAADDESGNGYYR